MMQVGASPNAFATRRLQQMAVDHGYWRDNTLMHAIEFVALDCGAGRMTCPECGGDGDWGKFHPEQLNGPMPCVECKGAGKVWVSI